MYCRKCGVAINDNDTYCFNCGSPQNIPQPPINPVVQPPVVNPYAQVPPSYPNYQNPPYVPPVQNPYYVQPVNIQPAKREVETKPKSVIKTPWFWILIGAALTIILSGIMEFTNLIAPWEEDNYNTDNPFDYSPDDFENSEYNYEYNNKKW